MAGRPAPASPQASAPPPPSFVVLLYFDGVYRGMAGPLPTEEAAGEWAHEVIAGEAGWTWAVEPLVHPGALPTGRERGVLPPPVLRVVR